MSAMWSPQQREWLQAMGYRVLSLAGSEPEPAPRHPASREAPLPGERDEPPTRATLAPVRPVRPVPPGHADLQATVPGAASSPAPDFAPSPISRPAAVTGPAATDAASSARPPRRTIAGPERRLYRALLRAAGQRTTRAAEAMLEQLRPDLAALRGDAAGKRALWVRLRALRRESGRR